MMPSLKKLPSRASRRRVSKVEQGQVVVLSALSFAVVLAFAALAVDVGQFLLTRTDLQSSVDAMALGGAQKLCGDASCTNDAIEVAENLRAPNGLSEVEGAARVDFDCSGDAILDNSRITAEANRYKSSLIAHIIGFAGTNIEACASAGKFALGGANGVVPFGIEESCLNEGEYGQIYNLKFDSDTEAANGPCDKTGGNFAALGIDASGAGPGCNTGPVDDEELKFRRAICFGASRGLCTVDAIECDGEADDDKCAGQNVAAYEICTETGNMTGPVRDGIQHRVQYTHPQCSTWESVAYQAPDPPGLKPKCDPWAEDSLSSLRVIMIPVVTGLFGEKGSHKVTIVAFAIFFLEDISGCTGNNCDIKGRFIKTQLHTGGLGYAPLNPDSSVTLVKLLE